MWHISHMGTSNAFRWKSDSRLACRQLSVLFYKQHRVYITGHGNLPVDLSHGFVA